MKRITRILIASISGNVITCLIHPPTSIRYVFLIALFWSLSVTILDAIIFGIKEF